MLATLERSAEPLGATMLAASTNSSCAKPRPDEHRPTHVHLAFQAPRPAMVDAFYRRRASPPAARDNGPPGERPYHPGYYACFVLDPDGNNIEAVFHGPSERSAPFWIIPI